ncbi:hypothetical protein BH09BAC3_BH09BAC3_06980 [soil metagenome]
MTRLKIIRKFRCHTAICGILSLAIVLGCDLFCDLGLISFSFPKPATVSAAHSHAEDDHSSGHHDDVEPNHHDHDNSANADHSKSTDEEGCCDDLTQRFYTSLIKTSANNPVLVSQGVTRLLSPLFLGNVMETSTLAPFNLVNAKFEHLPNSPPCISGQVKRVFISSFLI